MIRLATYEDLPVLRRMGRDFFNASGHDRFTVYNEDDMENTYRHLIDNDGILTDGEHAMIGFLVFPSFYNAQYLLAQELFWWVDEEKRNTPVSIKLLKMAEKSAKDMGAKAMMMLSVEHFGDKVDNIYKRMGYQKSETAFMRAL